MAKPPKSSDNPDQPPVEDVKDAVEDAVVLDEPSDTPDDTPTNTPDQTAEPSQDGVPAPDETPDTPDEADDPAPPPVSEARRGGLGVASGLVLGGLVAALIGFTAARTIVPEGWPFPGVAPEIDPLVAVTEAQEARIAELEAQTGALAAAVEALKADDGLATLRDDLGQQIAESAEATKARLDDLAARIAEIEKPAPGGGTEAAEAAAAAYQRELAEIRAMVEAELADLRAAQEQAQALEQDAAEAARDASGRAALARVLAALDTGQPFAEALDDVASITPTTPPQVLSRPAGEGAPTPTPLPATLPAAARAALHASLRAAAPASTTHRFTSFLCTRPSTRSLEPKEGDDPDAILSRAEDALRKGRIDAALDELDAMPEAARPALADWRTMAETRLAALNAGAELADALK